MLSPSFRSLQHTATHCNTLQHTATHCNTLQHTATHCNTLSNKGLNHVEFCIPIIMILCVAVCCSVLQCVANVQHTATHVLYTDHYDSSFRSSFRCDEGLNLIGSFMTQSE